MGDKYEMFVAELESARNEACEAYFKARPQLFVTAEKEKIFEAGFERAYKQQAETIELLKHGMKGDYDLDQWLDWAISKKHMMETIERLRVAINNLDSMEAPSDIKGRFQSELFWSGVYAARDALNKLEAGEL